MTTDDELPPLPPLPPVRLSHYVDAANRSANVSRHAPDTDTAKTPTTDFDYVHESPNMLESGLPIAVDQVPEDARARLLDDAVGDPDDDDVADMLTGGDLLEQPHTVSGFLRNTQITEAPPARSLSDIRKQPERTAQGFVGAPLAPRNAAAVDSPARRILTWHVHELRLSRQRVDHQLAPMVIFTVTLLAVTLADIELDPAAGSIRGPRQYAPVQVEQLTNKPFELVLPNWMFPPEFQAAPDHLSLDRAAMLLAKLFATTAFEIIPEAPKLPIPVEQLPPHVREMLKRDKRENKDLL